MIEVQEYISDNQYIIISSGHAMHDICVSVTANINTLHQFLEDEQKLCNVKINEREYHLGKTCLNFEILNEERKNLIVTVVEAIMQGIRLLQNNFPNEVNFGGVTNKNCV